MVKEYRSNGLLKLLPKKDTPERPQHLFPKERQSLFESHRHSRWFTSNRASQNSFFGESMKKIRHKRFDEPDFVFLPTPVCGQGHQENSDVSNRAVV
jgi:hypothetical protein